MKKVLIMGGGTGGHVFPGLAIAEVLRTQGLECFWLGTKTGLEKEWVPKANIPFFAIPVSGIRGKGLRALLTAPFNILKGFWFALKTFLQLKPDMVLGMGGYVCGPGAMAAKLLLKPLFLHEQNAIAGTTNRLLTPVSRQAFSAFPDTLKHAIVAGNPVRQNLLNLPEPKARFQTRKGPLRMLVLGGSRGALALNATVPEALRSLNQTVEVWHQSGMDHFDVTQKRYQDLKLAVNVTPFIEDMAKAYAWADCVICRAGALTVSELAAVGVASILIPFPHAIDNHQFYNAKFLADKKAGLIVEQKVLSAEKLSQLIKDLDRSTCLKLSEAAYGQRTPYAANIVAEVLTKG